MSDKIRDWVLPLVTASPAGEGVDVTFRGTAFLLMGMGGIAITAKHVAKSLSGGPCGALIANDDGKWELVVATEVDTHPSEDVAWLRLATDDRGSQIRLDFNEKYQATPYMTWGYPEDVQHEVVDSWTGMSRPRPDLVYNEGYVRRRMTDTPLDGVVGRRFFELSEVAGAGCSGAPVIWKKPGASGPWLTMGVYIGQRTNFLSGEGLRSTQPSDVAVGYAARIAGDAWFEHLASPND